MDLAAVRRRRDPFHLHRRPARSAARFRHHRLHLRAGRVKHSTTAVTNAVADALADAGDHCRGGIAVAVTNTATDGQSRPGDPAWRGGRQGQQAAGGAAVSIRNVRGPMRRRLRRPCAPAPPGRRRLRQTSTITPVTDASGNLMIDMGPLRRD